jgi:hypothetical protein
MVRNLIIRLSLRQKLDVGEMRTMAVLTVLYGAVELIIPRILLLKLKFLP